MFRLVSLILLLTLSLSALSDTQMLKRADTFMKSGTKTNQFRAYNNYKNLYLRSMMSNNDKLRIKAIKGIIKSGEKLHIDVGQYKQELTQRKVKSSKKIKSSKIVKPTLKKVYTPIPHIKPKPAKKTKIKIKKSHKLKSIRWSEGRLILKFDKKLKDNQINYFTLFDDKKKKYRYVFDIHASMLSKSQNLSKKGIDRIKLAQYKTDVLRLVIENSELVKVSYKKVSNKIFVRINSTAALAKEEKTFAPKRVDRNKTIVIDAGHGGRDPGAVGYKGNREKVVVLMIAKKLKKLLKLRGYKVYMTRDRDKFVKLSKRTAFANKKKADMFISLHANAVPKRNIKKAQGIECYFLSPSRSDRAEKVAAKENSADLSDMSKYGKNTFLKFLNSHKIIASNKLAIDLQRGMLSSLQNKYKVRDGGVREGPFWVLVGAQMPAVLVEVGFISHPQEAKRLVTRKYQKILANGLVNGIERYFANN